MKLSIVIPVYNVSEFLEECLTSICTQTFQDLELLCINDGSTDSSLAILREWEKKDNRIRVFDKPNGGVSSARNVGFEHATGDYITCVDPDDSIDPGMYDNLVPLLEKYDLDVLGCSFRPAPYTKEVRFAFRTEEVLDFPALLSSSDRIQSSNDLCFPWRFFLKRYFLNQHQLRMDPRIRIGEDMIFMMKVVSHAQRIYMTNYAPYRYRVTNQGSLMHLNAYKDYLESSYQEMNRQKYEVIRQFGWDRYTPISFDLARYTILNYLPYMIRNRYLLRGEKHLRSDVREILSMPMIRQAFRIVGFRNIFPSRKEYVYYLAEKFKIMSIVMHFL